MAVKLTPQQFVDQWKYSQLNERSAYQQHFIGLCQIIGHPTPVEMDHQGGFFRFEAGASKVKGGEGFADVWYRGHFAWEYKGKHANLDKAYQQLLQYREDLENPPLLIVSDTDQIIIHTNFTNTVKRKVVIPLEDLLTSKGQNHLKDVFYNPDAFRVDRTAEDVTKKAAAKFARLAEILRADGHEPRDAAHFLIRLLFCLFAEDTMLLPNRVLTQTAINFRNNPAYFTRQLSALFAAMSTGGGFGMEMIEHFDGHLFDDAKALELGKAGLEVLVDVGGLDWGSIEPAIFGTLFERSLDPSKRSQLGAHYTSKEDILLIIEPVLMAPLRRQWEEVQKQALALAAERDAAVGRKRGNHQDRLNELLTGFADQISTIQVLDPACGSGNFLYLALRQLLDLWKEVTDFMSEKIGLQRPGIQIGPSPMQLHGIEINEYAHQLAQTAIQIGYIQWLRENGYGHPSEPILKPLDNIVQMDAILAYDEEGKPYEPEWPKVDVIIGNPPFLGGNKIRAELGDQCVENLFEIFKGRVPAFADLVCYWFEKSSAMVETSKVRRVGLLATQAIRGGVNRLILERIKETGDIFWAYSDRDWILDGATVHVSMVGFDDGMESIKQLNGLPAINISASLQPGADLTKAVRLLENDGIAFIGDTKKGKFDISGDLAQSMLTAPLNPHGRPNADVVKPWINGLDLTGRPRGMYIIDFGIDMPENEASLYELPYKQVREIVKPERDKVRNPREKRFWWIHGRPGPDFRRAINGMKCYIATPRVSKHRIFVFVNADTIPDGQVVLFAREDLYFLGVVHSHVHEIWSRATGTQLRDAESGFRYSQTMTFGTFPLPWPPGEEPQANTNVQVIAQAASELVQYRDNWLNPPGASETELKKRTLTNLYNQSPTWLQNAHRKLDQAVFAAYGWPDTLTDEEILERLLVLNLERAAKQGNTGQAGEILLPDDSDDGES